MSTEPGNNPATGVRAVVEVLARALADRPEAVRVTESQHKQITLIELFVSPQDIPKVIGRQGMTINAIRSLLLAGSAKKGLRCTIEIVEEKPA